MRAARRDGIGGGGFGRLRGQGEAVVVRDGLVKHGTARPGEAVNINTKENVMSFKTKDRQRIIDGYLADTGRNMFNAAEFVDWLAGQTEHEAYPLFYGMTDEDAARQHRISLARRMASGLRIVARQESTTANVVSVTTREYPAYLSPVASRRGGGGYEPLDPNDEVQIAELRRQGAASLRGWLARYRGAFEHAGIDMSGIEEVAASQDDGAAMSA